MRHHPICPRQKRVGEFMGSSPSVACLRSHGYHVGPRITRRGYKDRVFSTDFDHVWAAASEVAIAGFHPDKISKDQGRLSLRTTPFYGYRLDVFIVDLGRGKIRISAESRGNFSQKTTVADGRRHCDRYLELVAKKVRTQVKRE